MGEEEHKPEQKEESRIQATLNQAKRRTNQNTQIRNIKLNQLSQEAKQLDLHINEFLKVLDEDSETHDKASLIAHAKDFDALIAAELDHLFSNTKEDLMLFSRTLTAIAKYREHLGTLVGEEEFARIAANELAYAEALMQDAGNKLHTLQLLFKKLKKQ